MLSRQLLLAMKLSKSRSVWPGLYAHKPHSCDRNGAQPFLSTGLRRRCPFPCPQTTPALAGGRRRRHGRVGLSVCADKTTGNNNKYKSVRHRVSIRGVWGGSSLTLSRNTHAQITDMNQQLSHIFESQTADRNTWVSASLPLPFASCL